MDPMQPLLFYQQIHTLNQQILAALEEEALAPALRLLTERQAWMREANRPSLADEVAERGAVLELLERIMQQDTLIVEKMETRQAGLGQALKEAQAVRIAQGYAPPPQPEAGEARFLDKSG
jgi:hypothetical protein